jgi:hypothetical protein
MWNRMFSLYRGIFMISVKILSYPCYSRAGLEGVDLGGDYLSEK